MRQTNRKVPTTMGSVTIDREDDVAVLEVKGETVGDLRLPRTSDLERALEREEGVRIVRVEGSPEVAPEGKFLAFCLKVVDLANARNWEFDDSRLPSEARHLLDLARSVPQKVESEEGDRGASILAVVGEAAIGFSAGVRDLALFTGECVLAFGRLLAGRTLLRWRDFWVILQDVSVRAFPIVALISFLVGLIIALLGAVVLRRFGAEYYVAHLVGYGMLREMGALMAGVIMAGRTGAAYAAEIGSMQLNEEIDALETFGISPIDFIVLPRLIALIVIMPILTIYADVIGVVGGYLVAIWMLDFSTPQFFHGLESAVGLSDFVLGVVKGLVFGILVAVSGCLRGMQCGRSASAVGLGATSAVVTGITLIVMANAVIDWVAALYNV